MQAKPTTARARQEAIAGLSQRLCGLIDAGAFDEAERWQQLPDHCREIAREKVAVSNPGLLQRVEE